MFDISRNQEGPLEVEKIINKGEIKNQLTAFPRIFAYGCIIKQNKNRDNDYNHELLTVELNNSIKGGLMARSKYGITHIQISM